MVGLWTFDLCGTIWQPELAIYDGADCNATCITSDFSAPCPFWTVRVTNLNQQFLIQVGSLGSAPGSQGRLNIEHDPLPPEVAILCDPASPHFEGSYVDLSASALGSGVGSGLHLAATDGPTSTATFGFFVVSADGANVQVVNNGILCMGTPLGRYASQTANTQGLPQLNSLGVFDGAGDLQTLPGTGNSAGGYGFDVPLEMPVSPAGQTILPDSRYDFQLWYRGIENLPGDSSNFSNMVEATF